MLFLRNFLHLIVELDIISKNGLKCLMQDRETIESCLIYDIPHFAMSLSDHLVFSNESSRLSQKDVSMIFKHKSSYFQCLQCYIISRLLSKSKMRGITM